VSIHCANDLPESGGYLGVNEVRLFVLLTFANPRTSVATGTGGLDRSRASARLRFEHGCVDGRREREVQNAAEKKAKAPCLAYCRAPAHSHN
jgi:hypothetical protein